MATYLVTGGCGFIGSHLCSALRSAGHGVRVLDDLSTGTEANLAPGADLVRGDVADAGAVREAMEGAAGCFHLAAIASVERGTRDWLGTHRANLSGTVAVFEAAARLGRIPVVYASSAAVYGDCAALPLKEDAPTRPLSAYGADKLGCEQHARVAGVVHGIPTLGLRFFNVFGPRQDPLSPLFGGHLDLLRPSLARRAGDDLRRWRPNSGFRLRRRRGGSAAARDGKGLGRSAGAQRLHRGADFGAGLGAGDRRTLPAPVGDSPGAGASRGDPPFPGLAGAHPRGAGLGAAAAAGKRPCTGAGLDAGRPARTGWLMMISPAPAVPEFDEVVPMIASGGFTAATSYAWHLA